MDVEPNNACNLPQSRGSVKVDRFLCRFLPTLQAPVLQYDVSEGQIKHHLLNAELMLENGNFDFIFCFNEVNMLKGIKGFALIGLWPERLTPRRE